MWTVHRIGLSHTRTHTPFNRKHTPIAAVRRCSEWNAQFRMETWKPTEWSEFRSERKKIMQITCTMRLLRPEVCSSGCCIPSAAARSLAGSHKPERNNGGVGQPSIILLFEWPLACLLPVSPAINRLRNPLPNNTQTHENSSNATERRNERKLLLWFDSS